EWCAELRECFIPECDSIGDKRQARIACRRHDGDRWHGIPSPIGKVFSYPLRGLVFDHLVGEREQRARDSEAERLGGPKGSHQFKLSRQLDREISRSLTLEYPCDIGATETAGHDYFVRFVAHQTAATDEQPEGINGRQFVERS